MNEVSHPLLPYTIVFNPVNSQFVRRYDTGTLEAAQPSEYLLGLVLTKLTALEEKLEKSDGVLGDAEVPLVKPASKKSTAK